MSVGEFDKETGSSDRLQPKQADQSCVHALNKPHSHEVHVFQSKHEADQYSLCANPEPVLHQSQICSTQVVKQTANSEAVNPDTKRKLPIQKLLIRAPKEIANSEAANSGTTRELLIQTLL
nr:hypothetical protein [Tanacetum cinerariifolium]